VAEAHRRIRAVATRVEGDREPGPDLASATTLVRDGQLVDLADAAGPIRLAAAGPRLTPR
jgi:hypothetical protein